MTANLNEDDDAVEHALARAAMAEEEVATLRLALDAARRRIADLEDFDYQGNTDPLLARIGLLKERVGRSRLGGAAAPAYRWLTRR